MPWVDKEIRSKISLYNRCKAHDVLPEAGGLMDQPEALIRDFDVIDDLVTRHKRRRQDEELRVLRKPNA